MGVQSSTDVFIHCTMVNILIICVPIVIIWKEKKGKKTVKHCFESCWAIQIYKKYWIYLSCWTTSAERFENYRWSVAVTNHLTRNNPNKFKIINNHKRKIKDNYVFVWVFCCMLWSQKNSSPSLVFVSHLK